MPEHFEEVLGALLGVGQGIAHGGDRSRHSTMEPTRACGTVPKITWRTINSSHVAISAAVRDEFVSSSTTEVMCARAGWRASRPMAPVGDGTTDDTAATDAR